MDYGYDPNAFMQQMLQTVRDRTQQAQSAYTGQSSGGDSGSPLTAFMQQFFGGGNQMPSTGGAQQPALFNPNGGFTPYGAQQNFQMPQQSPWAMGAPPSAYQPPPQYQDFWANVFPGGAPSTNGTPQPALFNPNGGFTPQGQQQMQNFQMPGQPPAGGSSYTPPNSAIPPGTSQPPRGW